MNKKQQILENLNKLKQINECEKQIWKVKAYTSAILKIQNMTLENDNIINTNDLKELKLGAKINEKIKHIIETGNDLDEVNVNMSLMNSINELSLVQNIGIVKATSLVKEHNIKTIEQLRENIHLLNDKQKSGLKYFKDIQQRIPREEMNKHVMSIKEIINEYDNNLKVEITGSYRRGELTSGDIDVMINNTDTCSNDIIQNIIKNMKRHKYICEDGIFAIGKKKFMGMCKLHNVNVCRRIDILVTSPHEYPFTILYFTGNYEFNVQMREHAKKKGFLLNEKGLFINDKKTNSLKCDHVIQCEKDIFDALDLQYVEPKDRKRDSLLVLNTSNESPT